MLWEQFFCLSGPFHLSEFRSPLTEPFMGPSHEYKVRIRDYHFTTHIAYYSFFQAGSSLLHRYTVFIASTTVLLSRFRRKCSLTIVSTAKAATSIFSRIRSITCALTSFFFELSQVIYLKLTRVIQECLLSLN